MKTLLVLSLAAVCLVFSGCPAYSVHPLYTDQDATVEPALEGTWIDSSDHETELRFQQSGTHEYTLVVSDPHSRIEQNYRVKLVRLGDQLFVDLAFEDQALNGAQIDDPIGVLPTHAIAKVNISGDDLAYATLEDEPVQKQDTRGTGLEQINTDGGPLVTAQTEALRRYVSAHADDAFSDWNHLTRKRETRP
jgi:hypothetical protein